MRRWRERYEEFGYDGLFDRRCGKPSPRRVPVATVEKVFTLYREKYFDLNVQHFHEKLKPDHGVELSYTWGKQALQGTGLVGRERKRGVHRKRRERRPLLSTKCPIATSASIACQRTPSTICAVNLVVNRVIAPTRREVLSSSTFGGKSISERRYSSTRRNVRLIFLC